MIVAVAFALYVVVAIIIATWLLDSGVRSGTDALIGGAAWPVFGLAVAILEAVSLARRWRP